jgi:hypothetical protein
VQVILVRLADRALDGDRYRIVLLGLEALHVPSRESEHGGDGGLGDEYLVVVSHVNRASLIAVVPTLPVARI